MAHRVERPDVLVDGNSARSASSGEPDQPATSTPDLAVVPDSPSLTKRALGRVAAYFALTKPRVIELLLVTTVPAMVLAAAGWPGWPLVIAVLVGGSMSAGSANTVNCWIERDRDQLMRRTMRRPLPTGAVTPVRALAFGLVLQVLAFTVLWWQANLLAAVISLLAMLFYVFVYTVWLKPRSDQNIVIGGAAGAAPALIGWAAVTGTLSAAAWLLFGLIFLWTPAHFWALAIRYLDDYRRGGFPMLPVVRGVEAATRQITLYAALTVLASLLVPLVADTSWIYLAAAGILGALFVGRALLLQRNHGDPKRAIEFFTLSNMYLAALFVALAADVLLLG